MTAPARFRTLATLFASISAAMLGMAPANLAAQTPAEPPLDTGYVIYDKGPLTLPLGIGLRIPAYNRVDGLALPWGPDIKLGDGRIRLSPTVTYRSHIGAFDPSITATLAFGRSELRFFGGRSTFSNDTWIRSDLMNSLSAIGVGTDARNYFRADRAEAELFYAIARPMMTITPSVGFLHEFAWSTGNPLPHTSAPWSVFGRTGDLKMRRINPSVTRGHATSALGGIILDYDDEITKAGISARVEQSVDVPEAPAGSPGLTFEDTFTQFTLHGRADFPTFGLQRFAFKGHAVLTGGDAPPQRFAYLGGSSTLSTVDLLALGGDRLLFVEGEYQYPLKAPVLQFVGAPVITLRYAAGSAGIKELPAFIQNVSLGLSLKVIKIEYHIDPSYREAPYRDKTAFSLSLQMPAF